jgi:hypothetical protein
MRIYKTFSRFSSIIIKSIKKGEYYEIIIFRM